MNINEKNINEYIENTIRNDIRLLTGYQINQFDNNYNIKLDSMECPYKLPKFVYEKISNVIQQTNLNRYPNPDISGLKYAIKDIFFIPDDIDILFGNGSDELINLIIQSCCNPGDYVISPWPSFVYFKISTCINHAKFIGVPLKDNLQVDMTAMLESIYRYKPKVIFLAIPNNPTGCLLSRSSVETILKYSKGLVVIDEAYQAFTKNTWMEKISKIPNAVILRTFSKIGLAGLRIGYMVGSNKWLRHIDKVRPPYNINSLTRTVLITILKNWFLIDKHISSILKARKLLIKSLDKLPGIYLFPSEGNFILVRFTGKLSSNFVYSSLKSRKILVKNLSDSDPLLYNCLRISVGTPKENSILVTALKDILS